MFSRGVNRAREAMQQKAQQEAEEPVEAVCIRHRQMANGKPLTLMNAAVYCFAVNSDRIAGEAKNLQVMRQFYVQFC